MRTRLVPKRKFPLIIGLSVAILIINGVNLLASKLLISKTCPKETYIKEFADNNELKDVFEVRSFISKPLETEDLKVNTSKLKDVAFKIAKDINHARKHIRGTKARKFVIQAMSGVTELLELAKINITEIQRQTFPSKHICQETYMGAMYGYPLYERGFKAENCTYATPIEDLVTIVVLHREKSAQVSSILQGIRKYNNRIKVIFGIPISTTVFGNYTDMHTSFQHIPTSFTEGKAWNFLTNKVNTEYTLVASNIINFDFDSRLERLVREIESLNVSVAGGASRDEEGFWKKGCFQVAYKNFTITYEEGYDESLHECIFCDYINGPFLALSKTLKDFMFDEKMAVSSIFYDFFLRLSHNNLESIICPDSMFHVHRLKQPDYLNYLIDLADKYDLYRFKMASQFDLIFNCTRRGTLKCTKSTGFALHPCCLQELTDMVKFTMNFCEEHGIFCELHDGTLLGAVKFGTTLPWERDGDGIFLVSNFTAFGDIGKKLIQRYNFSENVESRNYGGKYFVRTGNWHVEMLGMKTMDTENLRKNGIKPTKILVDGHWVIGPRNPGFHSRNAYGREIFAHAQHWMPLRIPMMGNYPAGKFTQCEQPGRHDCIDNFNADGNLQFRIPIT